MKFIVIFTLIFATANADNGLAGLLGPVFNLLSPITSGIGNGLNQAGSSLGSGLKSVGRVVSNVADGAGKIVGYTASGLGDTVAAAPGTAYHAARDLEKGNGLVPQTVKLLFGRNHRMHRRRPPPPPPAYLIHVNYTTNP